MVKQLETGETFEYSSTVPMPTASLIKLPIMIATYKAIDSGKLDLAQKITLKAEDKVPGSGILTEHFSDGTSLPLKDAIHLMIVYSDNTATNLVIDQVGLPRTNEVMKELGCDETVLNSKVFRRDTSLFPERSKKYGLGSTTAKEMVSLLEKLQAGQLLSKQASKQMLAHLRACNDKTKFSRLLPPEIVVAHKTGSVSDSRTDAGIIESPGGPIALCVLTTNIADRSWNDDNAAEMLCSNIAKAAYDYFNSDSTGEPEGPKSLKSGDSGLLVEALQRTLNARLKSKAARSGLMGTLVPKLKVRLRNFSVRKSWKRLAKLDQRHGLPWGRWSKISLLRIRLNLTRL